MPRRTPSPQELQEIRDRACRWGQFVARHAFGEGGPDTDVDLNLCLRRLEVCAL